MLIYDTYDIINAGRHLVIKDDNTKQTTKAVDKSISYICTWSWCLSCCRGWWSKRGSDGDGHLYFLLLFHSGRGVTFKHSHSNKVCL